MLFILDWLFSDADNSPPFGRKPRFQNGHFWIYYVVREPDGIPWVDVRKCIRCGKKECTDNPRLGDWGSVPVGWDDRFPGMRKDTPWDWGELEPPVGWCEGIC